MPNHVTNIIVTTPEVAKAFTREHTPAEIAAHDQRNAEASANYKARTGKDWPYGDERLPERLVDFALVIPPPNSEVYRSDSCSHDHPFPGFREGPDPEPECWYSWNPEHWGTKWNAYSSDIEPTAGDLCRIKFDTAWSHPEPVIKALSEKFPGEVLEVEWADENLGYNCGRYKIQNGVYLEVWQPKEGSDEALDYASQLKYGQSYAELTKEEV